jgi:hypothetical protein
MTFTQRAVRHASQLSTENDPERSTSVRRHGGHRNPPVSRVLTAQERHCPVRSNAAHTRPVRPGSAEFEHLMLYQRQGPNDSRRGMRRNRVGARGQHRRQHRLVERPGRPGDCEYSRPYAFERTAPEATFDVVSSHSIGRQLPELDESVLRRRDVCDHMVDTHGSQDAGAL